MTGAIPREQETTFAETYDRLAMAWVGHQDLRLAGAPISDLHRSALQLSEARYEMWAWWSENKFQAVR